MRPRNFIKRYFTSGETRRRAWGRYFERRGARKGVAVYKAHMSWQLPGPFLDAKAKWCGSPGIPADRCYTLFSSAQALAASGIEGATADCGVRYGKSSHFLLEGFADATRPHHIFDSFEGLSETGVADRSGSIAGKDKWSQGDLAVSEAKVRENLKKFSNCDYHRGWIPDSFTGIDKLTYALVHVDVDLYEPTYGCYEYFYPLMARGGVIICDDFGSAHCPGATRAVTEFFEHRPESPLSLPSGQCVIVKQ